MSPPVIAPIMSCAPIPALIFELITRLRIRAIFTKTSDKSTSRLMSGIANRFFPCTSHN